MDQHLALQRTVANFKDTAEILAIAAKLLTYKKEIIAREISFEALTENIGLLLQACVLQEVTCFEHIAYVLASAYWESALGARMEERASKLSGPEFERYDNKYGNNQLGDGRKYRGRGFIHITFKDNYARYSGKWTEYQAAAKLLLGPNSIDLNLIDNPDLMLDSRISACIAVHAMKHGTLTADKDNKQGHPRKRLAAFDSGEHGEYDFVGARAIVNGNNEAEKIADVATRFCAELNTIKFKPEIDR